MSFRKSSGAALVAAVLCAPSANAAVRETPSGLPVPRFAAFKHETAACRSGPSFQHPIAATYRRRGLPVEVIAETKDHWRRIRDFEGAECWVHQATLRAAETAIAAAPLTLYARPRTNAAVIAYVERGVVVTLGARRGDWRRVSAGAAAGWTRGDALWGAGG
jgi:SH3-like domain-containing protein